MKKIIIYSLLIFVFIGLIYYFSISHTFLSDANVHGYKSTLQFEKDLSKLNANDFFNLYLDDRKEINIMPFAFGRYYKAPRIIYIDEYQNFFMISKQKFGIYDSNGNYILNFDFPDSLMIDYYSHDSEKFYIFLKKHHDDLESIVYEVKRTSQKTFDIKSVEYASIDTKLAPPQNERERLSKYAKSISDSKSEYYGIGYSRSDGSLYMNDGAKYLDPIKVFVYKFDTSFKQLLTPDFPPVENETFDFHRTYDKYLYDSLDIANLFSNKLVFIANSYVNKTGDIYLVGIKSDEASRVKSNNNAKEFDIRVTKPTLFLLKLGENPRSF